MMNKEQLKLEYEESMRRQRELEQAHALADEITNFLNGRNAESLIRGMSYQHRSLQQRFTGFVLQWLFHLSQLDENGYDLRTEASVKVAKQIAEALQWENTKPSLPFI